MTRRKYFNQVSQFFNENEALSRLIPNAENLTRIQKMCLDILPSIFSKSQVLSWENHKLTLGVPSQAFAAKMRQSVPFLQKELQKNGLPVEKIQVKVKMRNTLVSPPSKEREPLSEKAKAEIEKLAIWLKEKDANSELTKAVQSLLDKT